MKELTKKVTIQIKQETSFKRFTKDFNHWWPQAYTWSQQDLVRISIGLGEGELCSEYGPDNFRCDWGRVIRWEEGNLVEFKWQISSKREPIPNDAQASNVMVRFESADDQASHLVLRHYNFELHAGDGSAYCNMMDSEYGWDYILDTFTTYCEKLGAS